MKKPRKTLEHWRIISLLLLIYDIVAVNAAYFLALWFRFDCAFSKIPTDYLESFLHFAPIYSIISLVIFYWFKLYNSIWRFASIRELIYLIWATALTGLLHILGISLLFQRMPISYYIFGPAMQFLLLAAARFSYRILLLEISRSNLAAKHDSLKHAMIIGAGNAGQLLIRDSLRAEESHIKIRCIIDDNSNKWGRFIEGIPVVGGREDIMLNVEKYHIEQIIVAIPSATPEQLRDILTICKETGCELKNLPSIYQMMDSSVNLRNLHDVSVEDLLGRDPIEVNMDEIYSYISGKTILVTGGGGSIGSELCRQIAAHNPKQLIIFDIYENNAYDIQNELKDRYPQLDLVVLIGSVRDSRRIFSVFSSYHPDIVYHAAAHKHVPLMEDSPCEAIKNNTIGTYKTAYAAVMNGCKRFVLISTDKAVNPTNIMGASKRLCEMVVQSFDSVLKGKDDTALPALFTHYRETGAPVPSVEDKKDYLTEFVAVRFGNVLGSNGSVIPLFKKQIAKGGPVTVTHPDIIRYFMTIPEAVSLVMQAGTYAHGGEIFVLDMGAPVKIDDLARNLIKLSGHKPDVDIPVVYTGLRPGEKLYEEKLMAEEGLQKTANNLIHIGKPIPFDVKLFASQLQELMDRAYANDPHIGKFVEQIVSTYHPAQNSAPVKEISAEKAPV